MLTSYCCINLLTVAPIISVSPTHDSTVEGDATESEFELTLTNADVTTPAVTKTDIVWKYEGNVISQSDGYRFSGSNDRLFIPVRESFAGQYSVEVTNAAGRATAVFNLSVLGNCHNNSAVYIVSLQFVCSSCSDREVFVQLDS